MITNNSFKFHSTSTLILENGSSLQLGKYLKKLGVSKVLVVTDSVLVKLGVVDRIISLAKEEGFEFEVYSEVLPEPPLENVEAAFKLYNDTGCDGVVGLGGGSPIDVAKAVAMLVTNPGSYEDYVGIDKVPNKCAPLILMPTTSGTGSEVSVFSIILVNGSKKGVVDINISADIALVDPLLTLSVPRGVTAATGLDALCHHIESFISINSSPLNEALCMEGIRVISQHLREAVGHGENKEARYWMSYASTLGGLVMNLTDGAAANHGLAFALGAKFHVGHGLSNAVMLPYVFPVVGRAELKKVRLIGEAMGENLAGLSDRKALEVVTEAITTLVRDVGCLMPLSKFGVTENDLDDLVMETETQTRVMGHSTYQLKSEEIKAIFAEAL
ncbi:iron-containing alcohol dehydrogenase [Caldibacillus lycopersici]|uniref:Iron-containing alcohol dehydrogenase n=1 Tax=Perspicuibacillus lycopersici TaxID=1325689 RepID=A0AAE3IWW8_9BACI|nr:iron-containing alcohol dehydrogenase [Perspicuibacillus lycopersici]MCU9614886.1 iron-containing alcohol dehydrogenase [Perspicuibacillus lycopersici]